MNRRELFKRVTGAAAAAGLSGVTVSTLDGPPDPKTTLVVLRSAVRLSAQQRARLSDEWERAMRDTNWQNVKVLALDSDVSIEVYQK